ncbi:MAG: selenide, water dikinase SelD [Candidatus Jordarchaeaceae archaeon]
MGGTDVVSFLAILGIPENMPLKMAEEMLRGINDLISELGTTTITGGHTVINPWPLVGGVASGIAHPDQIVTHKDAQPGDIIILTKPLGTQPAMAVYRGLREAAVAEQILELVSRKEAEEMVEKGIKLMTTSNKPVAEAMRVVKPHASTDVTGFGLLGHTRGIAESSKLDITIHTIPVIKGTLQISDLFGYGLQSGESAETAGGMILFVPSDLKKNLEHELDRRSVPHYEIGKASEGSGKVDLSKAEVLEV